MELLKPEHKKQLHDRILARCAQLHLTLSGLQADPEMAKSERARAVEETLAALQTHLTGAWDSVDESEALALARWLGSSRFLVDHVNLAPEASAPVEAAAQSGSVANG